MQITQKYDAGAITEFLNSRGGGAYWDYKIFMLDFKNYEGRSGIMTPILLCWPTTSEADVSDMAVEVETN
jgi:hypothetical protein